MGPITLGAMLVLGVAATANARLRVRATLHTPGVRVYVAGGGHYPNRVVVRRVFPYDVFEITRRDRQVARRLARFAGVPTRRFLRMRRQGYRWVEIGRWYDIPRRVVRTALRRRAWNRSVWNHRAYGRFGYAPRHGWTHVEGRGDDHYVVRRKRHRKFKDVRHHREANGFENRNKRDDGRRDRKGYDGDNQ